MYDISEKFLWVYYTMILCIFQFVALEDDRCTGDYPHEVFAPSVMGFRQHHSRPITVSGLYPGAILQNNNVCYLERVLIGTSDFNFIQYGNELSILMIGFFLWVCLEILPTRTITMGALFP